MTPEGCLFCVGACICGEDAWTVEMCWLLPRNVGKFAFSVSVKPETWMLTCSLKVE